jgi:hypothetical protein
VATNGGSPTIKFGPLEAPVEFVRWLIGQASLFVVLLIILYYAQGDVALLVGGQTQIVTNQARMLDATTALLAECKVSPQAPPLGGR